ncbi:MAG: adenine deaminase C-terminal domain-containing protein [Meiothermus sp.]|nr:adenine deaminase C-terminal domain-containing protein [Meiothermus sp.]
MKPLDLLVHNAQIADVVRLRLYRGWVGIAQGQFCYVEAGEPPAGVTAQTILDAAGLILAPGLIDAHMHVESSLTSPRRFAEAVIPHGTTAILADPHEIANVLGARGIRWMMEAAKGLPLRTFTAIPSCVPATDRSLETVLGSISADNVRELAGEPEVIALGELMDYQGLAMGSSQLEGLIAAAREAGLLLEGHTPTLLGPTLSDYTAHGITSDHTLSTPEKLLEQLTKGYTVMLQAKSLNARVVEAVRELPERSRVLLTTDDVMPNQLHRGHMSSLIQMVTELGWDPMDALASATLRPATYLRRSELGVVAPGRRADFLLLEGLTTFPPAAVYVDGQKVAEGGTSLFDLPPPPAPPVGGELRRRPFRPADFHFQISDGPHTINLMAMNQSNTFTALETRPVRFAGGQPETGENLMTVAVLMRQGDGPAALGLLANYGLSEGAFASTLAHDSHNFIVAGRSAEAMAEAANRVLELGGGMSLVAGDQTYDLALPIVGLLSDEPVAATGAQFERMEQALRQRGVQHAYPVLFLTLLALTVSPAVKMSDRGLVDVERRRLMKVVEGGPSA